MERLLVKTFLAVDTAYADEVAIVTAAMTMKGPLFLPRLRGGCFLVFNFSARYLHQLSGIWMIYKFAFYCTQANLCT